MNAEPPAGREPDATIPGLLVSGAVRWPDRVFARFEDGSTWTRAQTLREASGAAAALRELGVGVGDRVGMCIGNGPDWARAWWGASLLGAVISPFNTAYRGLMLNELVERVEPKVVVVAPEYADRFPRAPQVDTTALVDGGDVTLPDVKPSEIHAILFTSGTTGRTKASLATHVQFDAQTRWMLAPEVGIGEDDCFMCDLPMFHLSALSGIFQMLKCGGAVAIRSAPSMTSYWQTAAACQATWSYNVGTMAAFLAAAPPSEVDRAHSMRLMLCSPLPPDAEAFVARFGMERMFTAYGSTECGMPIVAACARIPRPGTCGRIRDGFEVRVADEHDYPVQPGQVGELLLRSDEPWTMSQGYLKDDEATIRAWRNGWFHTGDGVYQDEDGWLYFHDRVKDSIRRRGENVSSFEVEREIRAYPGVADVACLAVTRGEGDDEVKVFIVPAPGAEIGFEDLLRFLVERTAYFMVPRFYELIDALPKTASQRVQKFELRNRQLSGLEWDREQHGLFVTRKGLEKRVPVGAVDA